jgi:hypothetical protein
VSVEPGHNAQMFTPIEGFRSGVDRVVRDCLKAGDGRDDENVAMAAGDHRRHVEPRKMNDGGTIHLDHVDHFFRRNFPGVAEGAEAGVVDEQFDVDALLRGGGEDLPGGFGAREVDGEDFGFHAVFGGEVGGEILEAVGAARGEDEIGAALGEELCEFEADACTCAGYERPFAAPLVDHESLRGTM